MQGHFLWIWVHKLVLLIKATIKKRQPADGAGRKANEISNVSMIHTWGHRRLWTD